MSLSHDMRNPSSPRTYALNVRVHANAGTHDEAAFLEALESAVRTALRNVNGVESVELEALRPAPAQTPGDAFFARRPPGELGIVREV